MELMLSTPVSIVDSVMVSFVGKAAISAVALAGNISADILNLFATLATAVSAASGRKSAD